MLNPVGLALHVDYVHCKLVYILFVSKSFGKSNSVLAVFLRLGQLVSLFVTDLRWTTMSRQNEDSTMVNSNLSIWWLDSSHESQKYGISFLVRQIFDF